MKALQVLNVLLLAAAATNGQSYHIGSCPDLITQENFNVTKYMGTWYEVEKLPAVFEKGRCIQATYSLLPDGTVRVHNEELLSGGTINSIMGVAEVTDPSQPAILSVRFFKGVPESSYKILSTDYQSYALVYSCSDFFGLFYIDFAWILARTRTMSEDMLSKLRDKMTAAGVDVNHLTVTNQTACDGYRWEGRGQ
ncbi:apolipoprotein D-like [Melanotaenia boesemani]|uniref:apolipoprotein D-like n=1 Tax=Melanotaenia boesemani TaxID=1250792 RepID=UPI001C05A0FE|nr:apolipoprotein D-like [Melanotaenia boesemani]XP_041823618.1 apolipoprotein D-like [Melanotaenia boesemani]